MKKVWWLPVLMSAFAVFPMANASADTTAIISKDNQLAMVVFEGAALLDNSRLDANRLFMEITAASVDEGSGSLKKQIQSEDRLLIITCRKSPQIDLESCKIHLKAGPDALISHDEKKLVYELKGKSAARWYPLFKKSSGGIGGIFSWPRRRKNEPYLFKTHDGALEIRAEPSFFQIRYQPSSSAS